VRLAAATPEGGLRVCEALASARLEHIEARSLLQAAMGVTAAQLVAHPEQCLSAEQARRFREMTRRRRAGEPVAYLTGQREFYGLQFEVSPAVLIPRPETERLVELALERIAPESAAHALDLGTGSGAIALALAASRPRMRLTAVDASEEALAVARRNGARLLTEPARVRFLHSDWFSALGTQRFELIVSNPPYVAAGDPHLAQGDLRFEPRHALIAGTDGLACIRRIVEEASRHLMPGGTLLVEHGYDQAQACRVLLENAGFGDIFAERDLAGQARVAGGRLTG
jgi:release factor glutamine methyltransferase